MYWVGSCCKSGTVQCLCMMGCRTVYEQKRAEQCDGGVVWTKGFVDCRV